jgi:Cu/Ag efflux protein CusF
LNVSSEALSNGDWTGFRTRSEAGNRTKKTIGGKQMNTVVRCAAVVAVVALIGFGAVGPAAAGERQAAKRGQLSFEGVISAIDFKARTVTVKKKDGTMKFQCAEDCKFYVEGVKEGAKLSHFKVGDKVEIYYSEQNGVLLAHRIAEKGAHADEKERREQR